MRTIALNFACVSLLAVSTLAGCASDANSGSAGSAGSAGSGGSAGSPSLECTPFTACGGELMGTWQFDRECTSEASVQENAALLRYCEAATFSKLNFVTSGTVTFTGSAIKRDLVLTASLAEAVPASCNPRSDCAAVAGDVQSKLQSLFDVASTKCSAVADGCSCDSTGTITVAVESSYRTNDQTFSETSLQDGSTELTEFCVVGPVLRTRNDSDIAVYTRR